MLLVAQAANAQEALADFRRHRPDITLMDLRLPGTNGTDALITIRGEFPHARIIMLTTSDSDGEIQRAMRAGAAASILKSMPKKDLLAVIRSVHGGRRQVPPTRELAVIRDGRRHKQIADQLSKSRLTISAPITPNPR